MKNLLATLVCCGTLAANGQVLVYKGTQTYTVIGNNRTQTTPFSGNLLYEISSGRCIVIAAYMEGGSKKYRVTEKNGFALGLVGGSSNLKYTVFEELHEGEDGSRTSIYLKGLNSILIVATHHAISAPRTFSGQVRELFYQNGVLSVHVGNATGVYEQPATVRANNAGASIDDVVKSITAGFEVKGYRSWNIGANSVLVNGGAVPVSALTGQVGNTPGNSAPTTPPGP